MNRLLKIILLSLTLTLPAFAQTNEVRKHAGVGLSYVALLGDLRDYFQDGFAYSVNGLWELSSFRIGSLFLGSTFEFLPLKGDDIREASGARVYSLNVGVDQELVNLSWYGLLVHLRPEWTFWTVRNHLSRDYAGFDKGSYWGLMLGLSNVFRITGTFDIEAFIDTHIPEIHLSNVYFDLGLRLGKAF